MENILYSQATQICFLEAITEKEAWHIIDGSKWKRKEKTHPEPIPVRVQEFRKKFPAFSPANLQQTATAIPDDSPGRESVPCSATKGPRQ